MPLCFWLKLIVDTDKIDKIGKTLIKLIVDTVKYVIYVTGKSYHKIFVEILLKQVGDR